MSLLTDRLLIAATAFASHRRLSISRVSTLVFGDGRKLKMVGEGGDLTTGRFEMAMRWFSANWPADLDWPAEVPRPAPKIIEGEAA